MKSSMIEENLAAQNCPNCGGNWIASSDYWKWTEQYRQSAAAENSTPDRGAPLPPVSESRQAKLCPDCGGILIKYRVGHEIHFFVEECGLCKGIWLDFNEWESLKSRNLHDKMHEFFRGSWQRKIRDDETRRKLDEMYISKFGPEDYEYIKQVKYWIENHPHKHTILSFLNEEDPYKF